MRYRNIKTLSRNLFSAGLSTSFMRCKVALEPGHKCSVFAARPSTREGVKWRFREAKSAGIVGNSRKIPAHTCALAA